MAKNFKALLEKMPAASRARAEAKAEQMIRELPLAELREARALTQTQLASVLGVNQSAISKLERRTDMYLSTLDQMIRAMGGLLEIRAVFPEGPIRIGQLSGLGAPEEPASQPATARRVLVIDDSFMVRELAADVLRGSGYRVDTASDRGEVFQRVGAQHYALVMSDMRLPGMDGAALVRVLHERYGSGCPPVLLTSEGDQAPGTLSDLGGTLEGNSPVLPTVLSKPFRRGQLRRAVAEALKE